MTEEKKRPGRKNGPDWPDAAGERTHDGDGILRIYPPALAALLERSVVPRPGGFARIFFDERTGALGVRLGPKDVLRLILVPIAVNLAVLASLGPITGFFTLSTSSYHFMKLLNFSFFALSGAIGLKVLLTMLSRLEQAQAPQDAVPTATPPTPEANPSAPQATTPAPAQPSPGRARALRIFQVWLVIYAMVGAQMGWVLRPFIGSPTMDFAWFRSREANIFIDIIRTIGKLLTP